MIREIFTGNVLTKLMAFVMAVALWLYAINRHTGDVRETVSLSISVPEGITIQEQSAKEVALHLRGPQHIIDNLSAMIKANKILAKYTIPESPQGIEDREKQTIPITRQLLNLPKDIKLISIYPDKVDILLSKLQKKRLMVTIQKKGEPSTGYTIANEFVFPKEVEVTGPLNALKEVVSINTTPIDVSGVTTEQNRTFPWKIGIDQKVIVKRGDKNVSIPVDCAEEVRIWLQIAEQPDTRQFEKVKIKIMRPADYPYEAKLQDEFATIKVKGAKPLLDKLTAEDVVLYVDVTLLKPPGPYKQAIKSVFPKNVELADKLGEAHVDIKEKTRSMEVK